MTFSGSSSSADAVFLHPSSSSTDVNVHSLNFRLFLRSFIVLLSLLQQTGQKNPPELVLLVWTSQTSCLNPLPMNEFTLVTEVLNLRAPPLLNVDQTTDWSMFSSRVRSGMWTRNLPNLLSSVLPPLVPLLSQHVQMKLWPGQTVSRSNCDQVKLWPGQTMTRSKTVTWTFPQSRICLLPSQTWALEQKLQDPASPTWTIIKHPGTSQNEKPLVQIQCG